MRLVLATLGMTVPLFALAADDYAWASANPDGTWTRIAEKAIAASGLAAQVPSDAAKFCPHYAKLGAPDRTRLWVALLSAMARPESDFRPDKTYQEDFEDGSGQPVISRGLLQLSHESANGYECSIKKAEELHDPSTNLTCAVRIMDRLVKRDGVIATYEADREARGGGRYWSVLRESRGFLPEISGFVQGLSFCGGEDPRK
jgi:hypothetical protein